MNTVVHVVGVTGMQLSLYLLLPAWTLSRCVWRDMGEWLFAALVAGLASAALWGRLCNGLGIRVELALAVWLLVWILIAVAGRRAPRANSLRRWDSALCGLILLAWAVRSLHPLQTWALGQSDAYSHLGFIMDVLAQGRVGNPEYPPAYAWVMAFPARLWPGHAYWVARFGGAFFGAGLVLAVYSLVSSWKGRVAGLAAAALVAGCPLLFLLQKTGVGSFANQLGLLLIPAALWAFSARRWYWLVLVLAALAVAVPMMLLHLLAVLALWTFAERRHKSVYAGLLALIGLAGMCLLWLSMRIPPDRGMVIASLLTGEYALAQETAVTWPMVWRALATDYFAIKRWGYNVFLLNAGAMGVTVGFAGALAYGIRYQEGAWRLLGLWGLWTSVNVHLGLFQFTDYQREGWSFLIAVACLGGFCFDRVWHWRPSHHWRLGWGAGWILAAMAGVLFPPSHTIMGGPAESDMVEYVLGLDAATTVLVRRTSPFPSGQGDIVRTLHANTIHDADAIYADMDSVVFLRDRPALPAVTTTMRLLNPRQATRMEDFLSRSEDENVRLERSLTGLDWHVEPFSAHLNVWHLENRNNAVPD